VTGAYTRDFTSINENFTAPSFEGEKHSNHLIKSYFCLILPFVNQVLIFGTIKSAVKGTIKSAVKGTIKSAI
jgi:hypothetical protein